MKKLFYLIISFMPSFVGVPIRRLFGAKIGKGSRISFGAIVLSNHIELGNNVRIGSLSLIKADYIKIDANSIIKSFSILVTRRIELGKYVHVSPFVIIMGDYTDKSILKVGDHSRFFPFCWLEPGEGISIGRNVGIGGHTLIFTHGAWPDFLRGGPVSYGPVIIGDNVWLPWRVFIMPNVKIGANAIIGANSLVNKNVPDNVIVAGSPAKEVNDTAHIELSVEKKYERAKKILREFSEHIKFKFGYISYLEESILHINNMKIFLDNHQMANKGDLIFALDEKVENEIITFFNKGISVIDHYNNKAFLCKGSNSLINEEFVSFLRRYGVRLYIIDTFSI